MPGADRCTLLAECIEAARITASENARHPGTQYRRETHPGCRQADDPEGLWWDGLPARVACTTAAPQGYFHARRQFVVDNSRSWSGALPAQERPEAASASVSGSEHCGPRQAKAVDLEPSAATCPRAARARHQLGWQGLLNGTGERKSQGCAREPLGLGIRSRLDDDHMLRGQQVEAGSHQAAMTPPRAREVGGEAPAGWHGRARGMSALPVSRNRATRLDDHHGIGIRRGIVVGATQAHDDVGAIVGRQRVAADPGNPVVPVEAGAPALGSGQKGALVGGLE